MPTWRITSLDDLAVNDYRRFDFGGNKKGVPGVYQAHPSCLVLSGPEIRG